MKAHLWFILICIPDLQQRASTFRKPHIELSTHVCPLASPEHLLLFRQIINLATFLVYPKKHIMILSEAKLFFFSFNNHPRWSTRSQLRPATEPAVFANWQKDKFTVQMNNPKSDFHLSKKPIWFKFVIVILLSFHFIQTTGDNG